MDLVQRAQDLYEGKEKNSPNVSNKLQSESAILVHCSAGVWRTGTFIALYKLWLDYNDPEEIVLAILPIAIALCRQRMRLVMVPEQYWYIARCLR